MSVRISRLVFLIAVMAPLLCRAATGNEQYLEVGEICVRAQQPGACMASYGFECHTAEMPNVSPDAYVLGCNLPLADGRYHFVQLLHDHGGWNVELQKTYRPEYDEERPPEQDPAVALSSWIREEMQDYSMHATGDERVPGGKPKFFETGTRMDEGRIAVRAMCGVIIDVPLDDGVSMQARSDCESNLLRTVTALSQEQPASPYRVAGPSGFEWERRFARLVSGDTALVWEGRYTFAEGHMPCRWKTSCCSVEGSNYLDSCREPTEDELQSIQNCLAAGEEYLSEGFFNCLRTAGVKVGCEEQPDGSLTCY